MSKHSKILKVESLASVLDFFYNHKYIFMNNLKGRVKKKKEKKRWEFSQRGGEGLLIWAPFPFFLFIFKYGLNHPEMKAPSTPTLSLHQWEISQLVFNLFLLCQFFFR